MEYCNYTVTDGDGNSVRVENAPGYMKEFIDNNGSKTTMPTEEGDVFNLGIWFKTKDHDPRPSSTMPYVDVIALFEKTKGIVLSLVLRDRPDLANCPALDFWLIQAQFQILLPAYSSLVSNWDNNEIYYHLVGGVIEGCDNSE